MYYLSRLLSAGRYCFGSVLRWSVGLSVCSSKWSDLLQDQNVPQRSLYCSVKFWRFKGQTSTSRTRKCGNACCTSHCRFSWACSTAHRSNRPDYWDGPMLDRSAAGQLSSLSSRTKWQRLPAGDTLLDNDESCPTADLSNIRPSQWSGLFDQWAVEHASSRVSYLEDPQFQYL